MSACYNNTNNINKNIHISDIVNAYMIISNIKLQDNVNYSKKLINEITYNDLFPDKIKLIKWVDLTNLISTYNNFMLLVYEIYNLTINKYNEYFAWNIKNLNYIPIHLDNNIMLYTSDIDDLHKLLIDNVNIVFDSIKILLNPIEIKSFNTVLKV